MHPKTGKKSNLNIKVSISREKNILKNILKNTAGRIRHAKG